MLHGWALHDLGHIRQIAELAARLLRGRRPRSAHPIELTVVDGFCPAGRASTGGGYDIAEATIAFPGLFITTSPLANGWQTVVENHAGAPRNMLTLARCCRVPGR
jgi:hypothetical protein